MSGKDAAPDVAPFNEPVLMMVSGVMRVGRWFDVLHNEGEAGYIQL